MAEGFANGRLRSIARAFAGGNGADGPSETFPVPLDANAFDADLIRSLTERMIALLALSEVLLIDLDYDRSGGRYDMVDILLYQAMAGLPASALTGRRMLIIVNERLAPTDDLMLLADDARFRSWVIIADSSGRAMSADPPAWFEDGDNADWLNHSELRQTLTDKLLRLRGVFRSGDERPEYSEFRYLPSGCEPELQNLLVAYIHERRLDFVIFDGDGDDWFQSAVKGACVSAGIRAYTIDDFAEPPTRERALATVAMNAAADLSDKDRRFLVVTQAYKNGRHLAEIWRRCRELGRDDSQLMAIFCDVPEDQEVVDSGVYSTLATSIDGIDVDLDFFASVKIRILSEDSWQVRAAVLAGEVQDLSGPWQKPTSMSMLSLFASYGSGGEYAVPPTRPGIQFFPNLINLDKWDALWLAESLVRCATTLLTCDRSHLLVVVPDEHTAIRPISEAVEKRLDVAVAKIDRAVIGAHPGVPTDKVATIVRRYSGSKILLLDESTVTYRTLNGLDNVVRRTIGRGADMAASVIELPVPHDHRGRRPETMFSLASWKPLVMVTRGRRRE